MIASLRPSQEPETSSLGRSGALHLGAFGCRVFGHGTHSLFFASRRLSERVRKIRTASDKE